MSLRWRVALAVALVAAVATLAVGVASYRSTRDRLYQEIDRSLDVDVPSALPIPEMIRDHDGGPPADGAGPFAPVQPLFEQQFVDTNGRVVRFGGGPALPVTGRALELVGRRGTHVETVSIAGVPYRIRTNGFRGGAFQVARPLVETNRVLAALRARTMVVVLVATALAALLGSLIAGRVTASLRRLTAAADSVRTSGRLDVDVTTPGTDEVGRLGASFRAMLGSLARSQAEQRRLVQDAGHELKTPLTSIRTNLDVLRRHPDLDESQRRQVVGDLHSEVEEMVDLVEEIVALAGGVASDEPATVFSLGDAAADVVERYQRRTGRMIRLEADDSPVRAQPAGVQRAISNLVDNAVKFDASGGLVEVRVHQGRVDVLDRGPGIEATDIPLVFDRFHRGADARTMPGSGLGLSIVRDVVERHGGSVHASNRDGGGAVVGFVLPVTA